MAACDTDPWVSMVAEIIRDFPESGSLNLHLHSTSATFAEILADLRKTGTRHRGQHVLVVPLVVVLILLQVPGITGEISDNTILLHQCYTHRILQPQRNRIFANNSLQSAVKKKESKKRYCE